MYLYFFKLHEIKSSAIFLQYEHFLLLISHYKVIFEKLYLVKLGPNFVGSALFQGTSNHNFLKVRGGAKKSALIYVVATETLI